MEKQYFLAIDIGASSGRHILGSFDNGKLNLEEVYRFKNGAVKKDGKFVWEVENLFSSIVEGLKKCKEIGKIPVSLGIDTWGVDYALLDENDNLIDEIFSYRDERTLAVMDEVHSIISEKELYQKTGTQKQSYNTIYQLYCDKKSGKLAKAKTLLFTPDYLHFLLTGVKKSEYTIASTSGLINANNRDWDYELIEKLGYDKNIFAPLCQPGVKVGELKEEIVKEIGFNVTVCLPASHDTASAVMAVPQTGQPLYISSGTWSLMGIETDTPSCVEEANELSFTNEGGYNKSIRLLKNIMGLWMIQCVKKEFNDEYSFFDLADEARKAEGFESVVEVNDQSFFAPESMVEAIKNYCKKTGQKVPETVGEISLCIYRSLATSYLETVKKLEKLSGKTFDKIHIVGGGCQNSMLNELTAKITKREVIAGPVEATATGNIIAQMLAYGVISDLNEGKAIIKNSFDIKTIA